MPYLVNRPPSSTGGREEGEDHTRKKKTPTQLRRERKKRQRERERRQKEMERSRQQHAGGRRGNARGLTRSPFCTLEDSGIATSSSNSSLEEGKDGVTPKKGGASKTTITTVKPSQQLGHRHCRPILLERPHPTRDRATTAFKQLQRSREKPHPPTTTAIATPTSI